MTNEVHLVDNCLVRTTCPCCGSLRIERKGSFRYEEPQPYSSVLTSLLRTPELWRCSECQSGFVNNAVHEADSRRLYQIGNSSSRWTKTSFEKSKTKPALRSIAKVLREHRSLLDVGCGSGSLLDFAKDFGCRTAGVEYSVECHSVLERNGHQCFASIDEVQGRFDLIAAFDLVEHVYDLNRYLDLFHQKLEPGGSLIIITGNINCLSAKLAGSKWWYSSYPEHVVFPSLAFFSSLPRWRLRRQERILASPYYEFTWKHVLKQTVLRLLRRQYTGFPSFVNDHLFLELVAC